MALLPIFLTKLQDLILVRNKWSSILNPFVSNPSLQSSLLAKVSLISGTNSVNHLLGKKLTGWRIVRQRSAASIYDDQDINQRPDLTLTLISNASVIIDLEVF
jgi:hypothetical protein